MARKRWKWLWLLLPLLILMLCVLRYETTHQMGIGLDARESIVLHEPA